MAAGADVVVSDSTAELSRCDRLVVPGVGAFASCIAGLQRGCGADLVLSWVAAAKPLLGICVGHQVLFAAGAEHGSVTPGLGVFPGTVAQLEARRLPHMGWNRIEVQPDSRLFQGVSAELFYFVHSFAVTAAAGAHYASHESCRFVAAVEHGPICSTQFHPEKSGRAGVRLLRNWLQLSLG